MKSERTKQCKKLAIVFGILHFLCLFGPFLYFIPYAYVVGALVSKVTLSLTIICALVIAAFTILAEAKTRGGLIKTIIWLLLIGVATCLSSVEAFLYIMAIVSIVDELFVVKMRAKYKDAYAANREIDRRDI